LGENRQELFPAQWQPSVDVKDEPEAVLIMADIPGVDPKQIDIQVHNGVLTIKGERQFNKEWKEDNFHRIERNYGSFYRQFALPDNVDAERIAAKGNNGVLEIRLPKRSPAQTKRINIEE
jgi:HSP20 family protein